MRSNLIRRFVLSSLVMAVGVFGARVNAQEDTGHYAPINGLDLYYEIHGTGQPLILLHGGLGTIDMLFSQLLPPLAAHRQVIAVELQGHGHTADIDRPLSFEALADDVAALIAYLGLEKADVMGFSLGGGVALQTAIRHPAVVNKLVIVSAPYARNGWYADALAGMEMMNAPGAAEGIQASPIYQYWVDAAPKPEQWPEVIAKVGQLLAQDYDWSADVANIQAPVLLIAGDADNVRVDHMAQMFALLGGGQTSGANGPTTSSQLAILPGTTHFDILYHVDLLMPILEPFLDAPLPE